MKIIPPNPDPNEVIEITRCEWEKLQCKVNSLNYVADTLLDRIRDLERELSYLN